MGLTPRGEGARAILEGWTEKTGRLPISPSGGLKSKGHPVGATGVSICVLAAMQVTGTAGDMQIPGASLAGVMKYGRRGGGQFRVDRRAAEELRRPGIGSASCSRRRWRTPRGWRTD